VGRGVKKKEKKETDLGKTEEEKLRNRLKTSGGALEKLCAGRGRGKRVKGERGEACAKRAKEALGKGEDKMTTRKGVQSEERKIVVLNRMLAETKSF